MRRWAMNILCAASLLVFTAAMLLCARSWWVADVLYREKATGGGSVDCSLHASRGAVHLWREASVRVYPDTPPSPALIASGWLHLVNHNPKPFTTDPPGPSDRVNFRFAGQHVRYALWTHRRAGGWTSQTDIHLPLWLCLPLAIPPLLWWRSQRRRAAGRGFAVNAIQ